MTDIAKILKKALLNIPIIKYPGKLIKKIMPRPKGLCVVCHKKPAEVSKDGRAVCLGCATKQESGGNPSQPT